jgi:hypothetical protein
LATPSLESLRYEERLVVVEQLRAGFLRALSPDHANREPQPPQFAPADEIAPITIPLSQK